MKNHSHNRITRNRRRRNNLKEKSTMRALRGGENRGSTRRSSSSRQSKHPSRHPLMLMNPVTRRHSLLQRKSSQQPKHSSSHSSSPASASAFASATANYMRSLNKLVAENKNKNDDYWGDLLIPYVDKF
jgi:hypothetical protein